MRSNSGRYRIVALMLTVGFPVPHAAVLQEIMTHPLESRYQLHAESGDYYQQFASGSTSQPRAMLLTICDTGTSAEIRIE